MEWLQYALILLCPLMMIICMKGHLGGHQHKHEHHSSSDDLSNKVADLQAENEKLKREIAELSLLVKKES